jgi:hypothetical protein
VKGERLTVKGERERGLDKGEGEIGTKMPLTVNRSTLTVNH